MLEEIESTVDLRDALPVAIDSEEAAVFLDERHTNPRS
jgi:hypothetical protein